MAGKPKKKKCKKYPDTYAPAHEAVEKRLQWGRDQMAKIKDKRAPKNEKEDIGPYLDTQLFPGKKPPAPEK